MVVGQHHADRRSSTLPAGTEAAHLAAGRATDRPGTPRRARRLAPASLQADPGRPGAVRRARRRRPTPRGVAVAETRPRPVRLRVASDVGQRLGRDPVRRDLDRRAAAAAPRPARRGAPARRPVRPPASCSARCCRAPTSPSSSSAGGRRSSTTRRTSARAARVSRRSVVSSSSPGSGRLDQVGRRVGGEGDPGQGRPEAVVQLAAQPPALLLLRADQSLPGGLQLGRQHRGVQGDRQRRRQQCRAPAGHGVAQPALPVAQAELQAADRRRRRSAAARATGPAATVGGQHLPAAHGDVRQPEASRIAATTPPVRHRVSRAARRLGDDAGRVARSPYIARSTSRCSRGSTGAASSTSRTVATRTGRSCGDDPVEHRDQRAVRHDDGQ